MRIHGDPSVMLNYIYHIGSILIIQLLWAYSFIQKILSTFYKADNNLHTEDSAINKTKQEKNKFLPEWRFHIAIIHNTGYIIICNAIYNIGKH